MMPKEEIRIRVERVDTLPTLPAVMKNLITLLDNPNASLKDMADFITKDPAMTSRILRAVNSPLYGFVSRVRSVTQALLLLGPNAAKGLLLGVCVCETMQKTIAGLWEHSAGSAVMARLVAKRKDCRDIEGITIAALLHDIGKVLLAVAFPSEYKTVLAEAQERAMFVGDVERDHFGVTHAETQTWVAERWSFPQSLIEPMKYHHSPRLARTAPLQTAIVHLADVLIRQRKFGFPGDSLVPTVDETARLLLEPSENEIEEVLSEAEKLLPQIELVILADSDNEASCKDS
jgi:HD-like signal output (HDOD) protein